MSRWPDQETRFWSYVDSSGGPDSCWIWRGPRKTDGYGQLHWNRRNTLATHVMLDHVGRTLTSPDDCALHHCDNPPCVNPVHLFVGTRADNVRDMESKGRRRSACGDASGPRRKPERFPRGEKSCRAKLSENDVREILSSRESISLLSERLGVARSAICAARAKRTWRHVIASENSGRGERIVKPAVNHKGEAHGMAKLSESQALEIRCARGMKQRDLAKMFGVSKSLISHIRTGRLWAHLGPARKEATP